jgi:hypothetical protein
MHFGDSGYMILCRHELADDVIYMLAFQHQKEAGGKTAACSNHSQSLSKRRASFDPYWIMLLVTSLPIPR